MRSASAPAPTLTLISLGDSLTASYVGQPNRGRNRSWSDLLADLRPNQVCHLNFAQPGATSGMLLAQGQHSRAAAAVRAAHADPLPCATLIVGALVGQLLLGVHPDPNGVIPAVVGNVRTALEAVQAAGKVGVVLGTVPDIGVTPFCRDAARALPLLARLVADLTRKINGQLLALARQAGVPVVDLFSLTEVPSRGPVLIGGRDVANRLYGPDGYHPSTLGQGLLANAVLEALHRGYGRDVSALRLRDNELLQAQG